MGQNKLLLYLSSRAQCLYVCFGQQDFELGQSSPGLAAGLGGSALGSGWWCCAVGDWLEHEGTEAAKPYG